MKISKGTWLVVLGAVLVVLDQVIKILVKTNMELGETINVIGSWFQLHFVLNEGMAFGMAFGGVWGRLCFPYSGLCFSLPCGGGFRSWHRAAALRPVCLWD